MIDSKTKDDLVRFIIESRNGFCSQAMSLENIHKCERWIDDVSEVVKHNLEFTSDPKTPAEMRNNIQKGVWREAFSLNQLSPSEAAVIYSESQGEKSIFTDSVQIFQQKRGEILPDKFSPSPDAPDGRLIAINRRKRAIDSFLRSYSKYDFRPLNEEAQKLIAESRKNIDSGAPWMRVAGGMDVYETQVPEAGMESDDKKLFKHLVGYKTPYGLDKFKKLMKEVSLSDKAKLAYQKEALRKAGVEVDQCSLAVFNDATEMTQKLNVSGVDDIVQELNDVCSRFWEENIIRGIAPTIEFDGGYYDATDFSTAKGRRLSEPSIAYATAKELEKYASKVVARERARLEESIHQSGVTLDDVLETEKKSGNRKGKCRLGMVDINRTSKQELLKDELLNAYLAHGGTVESVAREPVLEVDEKKLIERAKACGIEVNDFYKTKNRDVYKVNQSKASPLAPLRAQLGEFAEETSSDLMSEIISNFESQFGEIEKVPAPDLVTPESVDSPSDKDLEKRKKREDSLEMGF